MKLNFGKNSEKFCVAFYLIPPRAQNTHSLNIQKFISLYIPKLTKHFYLVSQKILAEKLFTKVCIDMSSINKVAFPEHFPNRELKSVLTAHGGILEIVTHHLRSCLGRQKGFMEFLAAQFR